jgi:hypothetical protein
MVAVSEAEHNEVTSKLREMVGTIENVRFMPLQRNPMKSQGYDLHDHGLRFFGSLQSPSGDTKALTAWKRVMSKCEGPSRET